MGRRKKNRSARGRRALRHEVPRGEAPALRLVEEDAEDGGDGEDEAGREDECKAEALPHEALLFAEAFFLGTRAGTRQEADSGNGRSSPRAALEWHAAEIVLAQATGQGLSLPRACILLMPHLRDWRALPITQVRLERRLASAFLRLPIDASTVEEARHLYRDLRRELPLDHPFFVALLFFFWRAKKLPLTCEERLELCRFLSAMGHYRTCIRHAVAGARSFPSCYDFAVLEGTARLRTDRRFPRRLRRSLAGGLVRTIEADDKETAVRILILLAANQCGSPLKKGIAAFTDHLLEEESIGEDSGATAFRSNEDATVFRSNEDATVFRSNEGATTFRSNGGATAFRSTSPAPEE